MLPEELREHKLSAKRLKSPPNFKPLKKGRLPRPLAKMGGGRYHATDMLDVSSDHQVVFMWKDGEILTDRAFFGWLFKRVGKDGLYPLLELHWHPSHKGLHVKVPCNAKFDYLNRGLPGAKELAIHTGKLYDPQQENDRLGLVEHFCKASGIVLGPEGSLWQ